MNSDSNDATSNVRPRVLLDVDPKARNKATASAPIRRGEAILAGAPLSLALLPSQKGLRCDSCLAIPGGGRKLGKCSGCAAYWYCGAECEATPTLPVLVHIYADISMPFMNYGSDPDALSCIRSE